jgi:5-(hydroxymethyl)furfural/furfural oxidase
MEFIEAVDRRSIAVDSGFSPKLDLAAETLYVSNSAIFSRDKPQPPGGHGNTSRRVEAALAIVERMSETGGMANDYDVIIVGAGSAGAVLAARLSEDPSRRVLLLEAGPDYSSAEAPTEMRIANPAGIILAPESLQKFLWGALKARRTDLQQPMIYLRGRGVGGSSAINGQIAIRGMLDDFDIWASQGCDGWSGAEVLPYFIKLEDDLDFGGEPYHGCGGPIPVMRTPQEDWGAVDKALRDACLDLGYGWCADHNAPEGTGISPYAMNRRNNMRVSTNDAYLEPTRRRANLRIIGDALVDSIEFDGRTAVAIRVRTREGWQRMEGGEILLCAGAIHSPAILMRSGVGPGEDLHELGIRVVADLPVGHDLIDHPMIAMSMALKPEARCANIQSRHTNCAVRYSSGLGGAGRNDMFLIAMNLLGYSEQTLGYGLLWMTAYQTYSRGILRITSRSPEIDPELRFRMLSDERDLIRMRDGMKRLQELAKHPAITSIADRTGLGNPLLITQGASELPPEDAALDEWMMANCFDSQHGAGTCRMGPPANPRSVVDPDCLVVGLEGLRVIDCSVMPEIVRANTHLSTVMIAEMMADRIRGKRLAA